MAVIPLQSQRQVTLATPTPNTVQPSTNAVDPMAAAFSNLAESSSKLLANLAAKEEEHTQMMQKNQVFSDIASLDVERRARVAELQQQGTGDKPFVQAVMEDFNTRVKEMADSYSPYAREIFQTKILPLQEHIGKTALAVQMARDAATLENNTQNVVGGFVARVSTGTPLPDVLAQAEEYKKSLPVDQQLDFDSKQLPTIYGTALSSQIDAAYASDKPVENLQAVRQQIASGAYDKAGPVLVGRLAGEIQDKINRAEEQKRTEFARTLALAQKDPMQAAENLAPSASRLDRVAMQVQQLGVHPADVSVISKAEGEKFVKDFKVLPDIQSMQVFLAGKELEYKKDGVDLRQVTGDLKKLGIDVSPAVYSAMEYARNVTKFRPEYGAAVLSAMKDPNAGEIAKSNIQKKYNLNPSAMGKFESKILSSGDFADQARIANLGTRAESEAYIKSVLDVAYILADEKMSKGNTTLPDTEVLKAMSPLVKTTETRVDNKNAYAVPLDEKGTTPYSQDFMEGIRQDILNSEKVHVIPTFPTQRFTEAQIRENAGWKNYGDGAVALKVGDAMVYRADGTPVIERWDDLAKDVPAWKEHLTTINPVQANAPGGTLVVPNMKSEVKPFKRAPREKAAPTKDTPSGRMDLQLPSGMLLPPPSGE